MSRERFALSVLVLGTVVAFAQQTATTQPATLVPASRPDEWWQKRHAAAVERAAKGSVDLLFVGDSITQGWESKGKDVWAARYGSRNAANIGFSGDGTQHVLWRLDNGEIDGLKPRLAVVMIGTNNMRHSTSEEIAAGVQAVVGKLRAKLPRVKVLVLGIFPRSEQPDAVREKVAATNVLLAAAYGSKPPTGDRSAESSGGAVDANVRYLDIGAGFIGADGVISKEIMPDFLHLSQRGYELWADAIESQVAEMMK